VDALALELMDASHGRDAQSGVESGLQMLSALPQQAPPAQADGLHLALKAFHGSAPSAA
jgi:hypothetical protein